ncbi:hypothetical protein [Nocardia iowensis]|uniref:FXSXX-COOH protein n=1 Tax=Nocardia iowensis TaxID=204891 RepID=A0ABX8RGW0_NOCIO|nr:hypothetical protein [Nocardia iowensis]QXN88838.1 hypothetical protein KV110_25015 [Nocardia iowensis]
MAPTQHRAEDNSSRATDSEPAPAPSLAQVHNAFDIPTTPDHTLLPAVLAGLRALSRSGTDLEGVDANVE